MCWLWTTYIYLQQRPYAGRIVSFVQRALRKQQAIYFSSISTNFIPSLERLLSRFNAGMVWDQTARFWVCLKFQNQGGAIVSSCPEVLSTWPRRWRAIFENEVVNTILCQTQLKNRVSLLIKALLKTTLSKKAIAVKDVVKTIADFTTWNQYLRKTRKEVVKPRQVLCISCAK